MSAPDPVLVFLAGGATGILGTVVAEIAASRRQARQLEHEMRLGVRELALKVVGEAVDLMFATLDSITDLGAALQKWDREGKPDSSRDGIEQLLALCNTRVLDMRAHDIKLSLRFGDSQLIDCFSAVTKEFEVLLDAVFKAFKQGEGLEHPLELKSLVAQMESFSEQARTATGGI